MTFIPAAAKAAAAKVAKNLGKKAGRAVAKKAARKSSNGSFLVFIGVVVTIVAMSVIGMPVGMSVLAIGSLASGGGGGGGGGGPSSHGAIPGCAVIRSIDTINPKTPHATWSREQLVNAVTIVNVARTLDWDKMTIPSGDDWAQSDGATVPMSALHIAMGTAMQESSLRNLLHDDDAKNQDGSTADGGGLFQQQPSQGWGTFEQVTNPTYATSRFLFALKQETGWEKLTPWDAAHAVQVNDRASDYKKWLETGGDAEILIERIIDRSNCTAVPVDLPYRISSGYGPRDLPIPGSSKWHPAWDFGVACKKPIYAVRPGKVTEIGWGAANGLGILDPDSGATLRYLHQEPGTELVKVGDVVEVGQRIGEVGDFGVGGCHLDLRIHAPRVEGEPRITDQLTHSEELSNLAPHGYVHPDEYMGLFGSTLCPKGCTKASGVT